MLFVQKGSWYLAPCAICISSIALDVHMVSKQGVRGGHRVV